MNIKNEVLKLADQISILNSRDKEMIIQDLNHNEAGIAFEHIVGKILINKYLISREIFNSIKDLSKKMDFDNTTWERLIPLIH